jgi:hypothetical protein
VLKISFFLFTDTLETIKSSKETNLYILQNADSSKIRLQPANGAAAIQRNFALERFMQSVSEYEF